MRRLDGSIVDSKTKVKETRKAKMARLISKANDLAGEMEYAEFQMPKVLKEIKDLKPTKKELEDDGVQYLFDNFLYI